MGRMGAVAVALALLAAACGGAGDSDLENGDAPASPTTSEATATPTSTEVPNEPVAEGQPDQGDDDVRGADQFDPAEFIECGFTVPIPRDRAGLDVFPSPTAGELAGIASGITQLDLGPPEDWALIDPNSVVYRQPLTERSDAVLIMAAGSGGPGPCLPEGEPETATPTECRAFSGWMEASVFWFGPKGVSAVDIYRNGELQIGDFASNGNIKMPSDVDWALDDLFVEFGNPPLSWVDPLNSRWRASGAFSDFAGEVGEPATYELRVDLNDVRSVVIPCGKAGIAADIDLPDCRVTVTQGFPTFTVDFGPGMMGPQPTGLWRDGELVVLPTGGSTSMVDVGGVDAVTYSYEVGVDLGRGRGERRVQCGDVTIGAPPSLDVQLDEADVRFGATWSSPYHYATMLVDGVQHEVRTNAVNHGRVDVSPQIDDPQSLDVMSLYGNLRRMRAEGRDVDFEFHPINGAPIFWSIDGVEVQVLCFEFSEEPPERKQTACGDGNLLAE